MRVLKRLNRALDHLGGVADRHADRGGDRADFRRRAASLRHRRLDRPVEMGGRARRARRCPAFCNAIYLWLASLDLSWAQELCIYMFIWMAKFGAAYGVRTGIHVGVDVLVNMLPPASRKRVIVFSLLCGALFTGIVATFGGAFVGQMFADRPAVERSRSADVDRLPALPLGSGLMCFRFLQVAWWFYWTGELPHHDAAHVDGVEADVAASGRRLHRREKPRHAKASPLGLILILAPLLIVAICCRACHGLHRAAAGHARGHHVRAAVRADADRHAGLDRARPDRADVHVHADRRADRIGGAQAVHRASRSFEIMAIPFFILAGNFLTHGGVARRMISFATAMVGHWYGGLALAGVVACALFAAVSGSSPATVVAIGSVILPAMVAQGFPKRFGAGVITTSGSLGILIPPSIPMVLYAVATNTSVGKLFIAGIVPGIVLATMLGATTWYRAWRNNYPRMPKASFGERVRDVPRVDLGPAADRHRDRRHLHRPVHADRSGRDERGLRLHHRGVRLQGPEADATCRGVLLVVGQPERDAALHHHQRGAVLVPA